MQKNKEREKGKITEVQYLDEFVDVTTYNLVNGYTREYLQLLSSKRLMCSRQRKASVVKNSGRTGISLVLPLVIHMGLLLERRDFFY